MTGVIDFSFAMINLNKYLLEKYDNKYCNVEITFLKYTYSWLFIVRLNSVTVIHDGYKNYIVRQCMLSS